MPFFWLSFINTDDDAIFQNLFEYLQKSFLAMTIENGGRKWNVLFGSISEGDESIFRIRAVAKQLIPFSCAFSIGISRNDSCRLASFATDTLALADRRSN